ncbi:bifunctional diguanylate cyclase/phosphodiesterase [Desulforhopalus sp. IMCC35007]|uniref:putative bifunctional diguanylate cyclase/phosphodiesterase n=1 Tax=Desulforhopalus sp. IMCC35007 TaxID=2569543 RepID=UPI0010AE5AC3|nr:EAL domain-containing protein [Desulforhopalus sp. IMCC35007]TKB07033.1 EAL domain-containing protein [Desulforhopalus sp. IMCC35007]
MGTTFHALQENASLLKQKASRHSVVGAGIAMIAIVIATIMSGYFITGEVSLAAIITAQKNNVVLWVLDSMPFIFAFWGQYVSSIMSFEASSMILDQTNDLRAYTKDIEVKAAHEATHDALTDLPNRVLFIDRLQQATFLSQQKVPVFGILLLDIDRFKEVNDTLGHFNGDRLIKQVALRLSGALMEGDTLARIGGDEFGFILSRLKSRSDVENFCTTIHKSLSTPFVLDNLTLDVQVSIGAAIFPDHGKDADTLVQRADVAMYIAKHDKMGFAVYSPEFDSHNPRRLTLMGELRNAITNDELVLHYHPKVFSDSKILCSVEALVRWNHPSHGFLLPDEFVPLAERTGLINDLTLWILKEALRQCAVWHQKNYAFGIAVNISSVCLSDPGFPDIVTGLLASNNFPAESLIMEITETSIMVDPSRSLDILNRLHNMGVNFSIDDFGTGYSSLAYLKKLPVSELKIDKSFVTDLQKSRDNAAIVNAIIQLAHNLGLKVVAEGVEDKKTFDHLKILACDIQQGFWIGEPFDAEAFEKWLDHWEAGTITGPPNYSNG